MFVFFCLWPSFWRLRNSPVSGLDWVLLMTCLSAVGRVLQAHIYTSTARLLYRWDLAQRWLINKYLVSQVACH